MFWRVSKERIVGRLMLSDVVVEQSGENERYMLEEKEAILVDISMNEKNGEKSSFLMGFLYLNIKKSMAPDAIGLMMVWKCIVSKLISNSKQSNANLIGNSITWSKELFCSANSYSLQISGSKCDCKFKANCCDKCQNCFAPFPVVEVCGKALDLNWVAKFNNTYQM